MPPGSSYYLSNAIKIQTCEGCEMNDEITVERMAAIRATAGLIEVIGAVIILRLGTISKGLQVNAILATIGPLFMLAVTGIGLAGLTGRISPAKVVLIGIGTGLIIAGSR
jgi:hypothetical protein